MPRFSNATLANLIEALASTHSHSELDLVLFRMDCRGCDEDEFGNRGNKIDRMRRMIESLEQRDPEHDELLDLVVYLIEDQFDGEVETRTGEIRPVLAPLVRSLRSDGLEVAHGRVVPTTSSPARLSEELSHLELELEEAGFAAALTHYQQAVHNFRDGNLEASNGQLRSFLESLLIEGTERATGERRTSPTGAVDRLRGHSVVDGNEAQLLKGLLGISNQRGAHHGISSEQEAQFRLHFSSSAARYVLAIFAQRS